MVPSIVVGGFGRPSGFLVEPLVGDKGVRLVPSFGLNTARKDEQQLPIVKKRLVSDPSLKTTKLLAELSKHWPRDLTCTANNYLPSDLLALRLLPLVWPSLMLAEASRLYHSTEDPTLTDTRVIWWRLLNTSLFK